MKTVLRLVLAALASAVPATLLAQTTTPDLGLATLEELMGQSSIVTPTLIPRSARVQIGYRFSQ